MWPTRPLDLKRRPARVICVAREHPIEHQMEACERLNLIARQYCCAGLAELPRQRGGPLMCSIPHKARDQIPVVTSNASRSPLDRGVRGVDNPKP